MANIGVRSTYNYTVIDTGGENFKVEISINGALRYTLQKVRSDNASFDISELIRDYLDITYDGTMPSAADLIDSANGYSADVSITNYVYSDAAGTTQIGTATETHEAYDAYNTFDEQDNSFTFPSNEILITADSVWLPEGESMEIYYTSSNTINQYEIGTTHPEGNILLAGYTLDVRRYPCTKYDPTKLVFVNRFGMLQELWFFGSVVESTSVTSETFKSANITTNYVYSKYEHQYKKFDVKGKKSYTISSGFVSESYNASINELLLSEQVWMHIDNTVRPINVVTSGVSYKTSLNDKLVQYTLEVEQANDFINTIR